MESLAQQTRAQSLIILAALQSRTSSSLSSIRLSVVSLTETRNSSQTHIAKSFSRQRTSPWIAGIGPLSTIAARASRLAVREPLGAMRVEPQHPVPDRLQTDPADAGCLCARAAVIDLGHCQEATPLGSALRPPSHPAQASGVIVLAKCKPRSHGESPLRHHRF